MGEPPGALLASYRGAAPRIAGAVAFAGEGAAVLGRASLGRGAWLGAYSVIRADGQAVEIGDDFHLGEHGTVHVAHETHPTRVGRRVSAGAGAVIHACSIADDCVIERGAIVLDGAEVGAASVLSADCVVFPRAELAAGWLYAGSPARPVARVSEETLAARHQRLRSEAQGRRYRKPEPDPMRLDGFLAPSAYLSGDVRTGCDVGVWYGCHLDAGRKRIVIGGSANIQDNSAIFCEREDVVIAENVTVGHNATLIDCRIEADSLIGIGALVSPGVVVERDVLLAAGAETEIGQRLTGGRIWGGRPARPIGEMTDRTREMLAAILPRYRGYADQFRTARHTPLVSGGDG